MNYSVLCEAFEEMDARMKALFIDSRLKWATNAMLISELSVRLYGPIKPPADWVDEEDEPPEE